MCIYSQMNLFHYFAMRKKLKTQQWQMSESVWWVSDDKLFKFLLKTLKLLNSFRKSHWELKQPRSQVENEQTRGQIPWHHPQAALPPGKLCELAQTANAARILPVKMQPGWLTQSHWTLGSHRLPAWGPEWPALAAASPSTMLIVTVTAFEGAAGPMMPARRVLCQRILQILQTKFRRQCFRRIVVTSRSWYPSPPGILRSFE